MPSVSELKTQFGDGANPTKQAAAAAAPMAKKFPWGDDPVPQNLIIGAALPWGAAVNAVAIALTTPSGPIVDRESAKGPIVVMLLWVWSYYNMIGAQMELKMSPLGDSPAASKVSERSLYNTIEQSLPFLVLFWLMAAQVDAALATSVGGLYVALRALYPVLYAYYGTFNLLCEFATQPNYMAINYFAVSLIFDCFGASPIHSALIGRDPSAAAQLAFYFFFNALFAVFAFLVLWKYPFGALAGKLNIKANSPPAPVETAMF